MLSLQDVKYWELVHNSDDLGRKKESRYSCRCDICNEGTNKKSKRLDLYIRPDWETAQVHCYNCGYSKPFWFYLKDNHPYFYSQYEAENRADSFNSLKSKRDDSMLVIQIEPKPEVVEVESDVPSEFTSEFITAPYIFTLPEEFKPLETEEWAVDYVNSRKVTPKDWYCFDGKKTFDDTDVHFNKFIFIPMYYGNKVYGYQGRSTLKKVFYTNIPSENSGWKVWNWYNVDNSKSVYIFESIFDALSSGKENCVAQLGADLNADRIKELNDPVFALDNQWQDHTSKTKSMKLLEEGFKVFLWPKAIPVKDFNALLDYMPSDKISEIIDKNTFEGLEGILKLKLGNN